MAILQRIRQVLPIFLGLFLGVAAGCATSRPATPDATAPAAAPAVEPEPAAKFRTGPTLVQVLVWRNRLSENVGISDDKPDHYLLIGSDLKGLLAGVYDIPETDIKGLDGSRNARLGFEIIGKHDASRRLALMSEAARAALGYTVVVSQTPGEVIELTRAGNSGPPLSIMSPPAFSCSTQGLKADGYSMHALCNILEERLNVPVIDRTNLRGKYFAAITLPSGITWESREAPDIIAEQLGLHARRATKDRKRILVEWP